jgi:hypothetical protein
MDSDDLTVVGLVVVVFALLFGLFYWLMGHAMNGSVLAATTLYFLNGVRFGGGGK